MSWRQYPCLLRSRASLISSGVELYLVLIQTLCLHSL
nr:MAG TPA: hypothetical protein [Caudoviricetes sp.]